MATEEDSWAIRVTADVADAGRAFDEIARRIETVTKDASERFGLFDKAVAGMGGTLLATAAKFTPFGRAASALFSTLRSAAGVGREIDASNQAFPARQRRLHMLGS